MSKGKIGAGIALDGEKEFKQAVSGINKDLAVLASEMAKTGAQFGKNADSLDALQKKSEQYNAQADKQREKVEALKKALENSAKQYGENDNRTKQWQITLNKAEADLAKTENALSDVNDRLENFGKEADDAGKEISDAGKQAEKSGDNAKKGSSGWDGLGAGLSKAAGFAATAAKAFAGAAVATAAGIIGVTKGTEEFRQDFAKLSTNAQQAGVSIDEVNQHLRDMDAITGETDSNIEGLSNLMQANFTGGNLAQVVEELSGAVIKFPDTLKFESLADGLQETLATGAATGPFSELLERMGLNLDDFNKALSTCTTDAQKQQLVLDTLAKSGLADVNDAYRKNNEVLIESANAQYDLREAMADIGEVTAPLLASAMGTLAGYAKDLTGAFQSGGLEGVAQKFKQVVGELSGMLAENLSSFATVGTEIIVVIVDSIIENLPALIESATQIATALTTALIELLPQLLTAGVEVIVQLAQGIAEALPELIPAAVNAILTLTETLVDNIDLLVSAALQLVIGLAEGIIIALPELIQKAPGIIQKLCDALVNNIPLLAQAAWQLIFDLAAALIQNLPQIVEAAYQIVTSLAAGLIQYVGKVIETAQEIAYRAKETFLSLDWMQIGVDIIRGIVNGIKNRAASLVGAIQDVANSAIRSAKKALGINSPSRVFAEIGGYMAEGMGQGFERTMSGVQRRINAAIPIPEVNLNTGTAAATPQMAHITMVLDGKVIGEAVTPVVSQRIMTATSQSLRGRGLAFAP